jgi:carbon monoxide dehydrogenase subunit G
MYLERSIEIRRSPEEIFAYLSKHANHVNFIEENVSCEQVSPGPMAVGTKLKNVAKVFGRQMVENFEVITFEPPRVIAKSSRGGSSFETTDRFELTPNSDGTRVNLVITGTPRNLGERLLIALITPVLNRSMKKMLAKLKTILEQA